MPSEAGMTGNPSDWREFGVRIVRHGEFDSNTPQTPGMHREAAISRASAGSEKIWAGTAVIQTAPRPVRTTTVPSKA
jgi:uncharacterized RmlC-like cupin family protein